MLYNISPGFVTFGCKKFKSRFTANYLLRSSQFGFCDVSLYRRLRNRIEGHICFCAYVLQLEM